MNGNNFNGAGTSLDQRVGINERPLDLLSYNNALRRECDKTAASIYEKPEPTPKPEPGDDRDWFYVEDVSGDNNTLTFNLKFQDDPHGITASYDFYVSKDKNSWTKLDTLNSTSKTITYEFRGNERVYIRCNANSLCYDFDADYWYSTFINCVNSYNVGGNIMSLLYGSEFTGNEIEFPQDSTYTFSGLFNESETLKSAENLILPATTLTSNCYSSMFEQCESLTTAPELPATVLAAQCYNYMFYGCTSLTTAPQLPATTLTNYCYQLMFCNCTSLTTSPQLPATELADLCYQSMFQGCTSLNKVISYANNISAYMCLSYWLSGVAQSGTFYNLGSASYSTGTSGIPEGWTVETELPQE